MRVHCMTLSMSLLIKNVHIRVRIHACEHFYLCTWDQGSAMTEAQRDAEQGIRDAEAKLKLTGHVQTRARTCVQACAKTRAHASVWTIVCAGLD